jgi:hypothetical protein
VIDWTFIGDFAQRDERVSLGVELRQDLFDGRWRLLGVREAGDSD